MPKELWFNFQILSPKKLYSKSYFGDCRSPKSRSILGVCEDSEDEQDAKRALLDSFFLFGFNYFERPIHKLAPKPKLARHNLLKPLGNALACGE